MSSRSEVQPKLSETELRALAEGLREAAHTDAIPGDAAARTWQAVTRFALDRAGIEVSPEQFDQAWRVAWQRAFMGGSYTHDARAILRAIHEVRAGGGGYGDDTPF